MIEKPQSSKYRSQMIDHSLIIKGMQTGNWVKLDLGIAEKEHVKVIIPKILKIT